MVTFGSHVGNHQFQPFLSGVYAGVILVLSCLALSCLALAWLGLAWLGLSCLVLSSVCLSAWLAGCLAGWLAVCKLENAAILRDFNLATSETKQFCEISSVFELDNIKNEAILRDFLQKWKVECRAHGLVPMRFAIFSVHVSTVLRLPRKSETIRSSAPFTQNHLPVPEDLMLQNATPLRKSAPYLFAHLDLLSSEVFF